MLSTKPLGELLTSILAPHKFASILFPLKALKLILSELRSEGDGERVDGQGNPAVDLDSDDGVSYRRLCTYECLREGPG